MQRLRTTFKRSRTPTGAEMKTQSSLEVPKQVRSASFDEIQLEAKRSQKTSLSPRPNDPGGSKGKNFLALPSTSQSQQPRSKSFDSGGSHADTGMFLDEEGNRIFQRRKSSGDKAPPYCIHCILLEEFRRSRINEPSVMRASSDSDYSTSDDENEDSDIEADEEQVTDPCQISVDIVEPEAIAISPQCLITVTPSLENQPVEEYCSPSGRRRSITSAKLERQEAFIFNETPAEPSIVVPDPQEESVIVSQFFLVVPDLKRDRAASVDSSFLNKPSSGKSEEVVPQSTSGKLLEPPSSGSASLRSRSVDIVLPTDQQAHYKALAMNSSVAAQVSSGDEASGGSAPAPPPPPPPQLGAGAAPRVTPDWSNFAVDDDHLWITISPSNDFCYCGEHECAGSKSKPWIRYRCSACKIVCHATCLPILERLRFTCRPSFRSGVRNYRDDTATKHHWVHRRQQKGKCKACSKAFQSKLSFSTKDIVAVQCSWCKDAYHNKPNCFRSKMFEEDCSLGIHEPIIVPPAWIVKLPGKDDFKSSLRKSPKKKSSSKKKPSKEKSESDASKPSVKKERRIFTLKPIPTSNTKPVIIFINPKSGGNQGIKLLQKFQWLLNPRQVFDLTQGGPRFGLELFRKAANLRVLACGGDGTVGWVLSVIDQLGFNPPPAVGVLPLGTGNDLARALGWGGGYTDEPISKILESIGKGDISFLDRWQLSVEKNSVGRTNAKATDKLPLNVVNNYFSMGVDAHIALEFHQAREAHPEKFNSRLRNKMFYGQAGGKDLVIRKWKGLADHVTLKCDDRDITPMLKEHKFHAIVFLNIPSYGGGTHPWAKTPGIDQSTEDGFIEVVGLSTYQLPLLQAGGHGTNICQCKTALITTTKAIPMQVDGEACKLNPSVITISLLNRAPMLAKKKGVRTISPQVVLQPLKISINMINMMDYEQYHNDKARLKNSAVNLGVIEITPVAELVRTRQIIDQQIDTSKIKGLKETRSPRDWCFVDTCTAERFFRIDRAQEHLHYLADIASDAIYILDQTIATPAEDSASTASTSTASAHLSPTSQVEESTPGTSSSDEAQVGAKVKLSTTSSGGPSVDRQCKPKQEIKKPGVKKQEVRDTSPVDTGYISNLLEKTTDGVVKAAKGGDIKKLKELHGHGYSLLSIDSTGQTALHYSAQNGYKDVVKYLIASAPHSILNMADNEKGQTALHKAASNRHRSICCMLVAGGASLSLVDNFGNTPRLLALQASDQQLAAYLESQEQFQLLAEDMEAS